jgi:hypothetical protein
MRQECIQAVQQAAQRTLTAREIQNIEDRIYRNMRSIARDDPMSWRQLSESERLYRAAQLASEELQREAALKKRRVALTIAARQRLDKSASPGGLGNSTPRIYAAVASRTWLSIIVLYSACCCRRS